MNAQKGNVLFLILIAVALFAALSYAVTRASRSGTGNATSEKAQVSAARILNFSSALHAGLIRLMTVNGVDITGLNFNNDIYKRKDDVLLYSAMGNPANPALYVFHPKGGGVAPQTFEDLSLPCSACAGTNTKEGHTAIIWLNIPDIGTTTADVVAFVSGLRADVCLEINRKLGITGIPELNLPNATFLGTTSPPVVVAINGTTSADLDAVKGRSAFCVNETSTGDRNVFIDVLKSY